MYDYASCSCAHCLAARKATSPVRPTDLIKALRAALVAAGKIVAAP